LKTLISLGFLLNSEAKKKDNIGSKRSINQYDEYDIYDISDREKESKKKK
jgi:hypothetical protein